MDISKIDDYLTESATSNRFNKLLKKYSSDLKKLKDNMRKSAEFFINQINDEEELDSMYDMLNLDDDVQKDLAYKISARMYHLEKIE